MGIEVGIHDTPLPYMPSDEQFVRNVRQAQRCRRPLGVVLAVLGLAGVTFILCEVHSLRVRSIETLDQLSRVPHPTTQHIERTIDETRFSNGFSLGFVCAAGLAGASPLLIHGLVWAFVRSRKDQLLLKCWDERLGNERQKRTAAT